MCLLAGFAVCAIAVSAAFAMPPPASRDDRGDPVYPICPTESEWGVKRVARGLDLTLGREACATGGACDDPAVRDATDQAPVTVRVIVHLIGDAAGSPPEGITRATVAAQMDQLNRDYAECRIAFVYQVRFHADPNHACIRAYSSTRNGWQQDIAEMKRAYAEDPAHAINIFVACQGPSPLGVAMGMATFPWDADALSSEGGMWINADYFGAGHRTLTHEMGHALGLWHTHHGVDETGGCEAACAEGAHAPADRSADRAGDYCADTPATPMNHACSEPPGTDCTGSAWSAFGPTDVANFMGYGPDACTTHFSAAQRARMHCWMRSALPSLLTDGALAHEAPAHDEMSITNHPNPFNPTTTFRFALTTRALVALRVYDVTGRLVASIVDDVRDAGIHEVVWNGRSSEGGMLPSGVYHARLTAGGVERTRRVVLVK